LWTGFVVNDFKSALGNFLVGQLDFAGLDAALIAALQADPAAAPEILQLIENIYRAGRLPPQLHGMLKARVGQPAGGGAVPPVQPTTPVPPVVDDPDKTRIRMPPQPVQPAQTEDTDKTQIRMPPIPPGAPASNTGPAPPPAADVTSPTGAYTTPPTSPPTSGVTRSGEVTGTMRTSPTSATTGADSSWADMKQATAQTGETLQVGSVIKGRFVFEELIGHGGMGEVYKARDLRKEEAQDRNPYVAVKILNDSFKTHPESLKALQRESRKAQNLAHPNIVNVFDFDRDGGNVYMTMEFLDGEPLDVLVRSIRDRGLDEKKGLHLVNDMGHALAYAHKNGMVHSDFKPGNAFLTRDGTVKVFDFGIARATKVAGDADGEKTLFDAGELGALTPAYASYEMLEGEEPDARDDIYALACVAYELLTGQHPFNKLPANQAKEKGLTPAPVKGLSRRQWKGLLRGLAFDRKDRSPDVDTFLAEIARRKIGRSVIVGAVASALLIVVLLGLLLPDYLNKRRITAIISALKSGDTPTINEALATVKTLEGDDRAKVIQEAKTELTAWYQAQIDAAINESQGRYDYPTAERVARRALEMYPDSARIQGLSERVESRKNQLLNELNTRYNQHLADGRLLPLPGDDMDDVLKVLAQVQPDHPLLNDPRLPAAYAEQGASLFERGDLEPAMAMVDAGLARFPEDANLVNLHDRVSAEQESIRRKTRIAELEQLLGSKVASLDSLQVIDTLREPVNELRGLKADAPVLSGISRAVEKQLEVQLKPMIVGRDWDTARALLGEYADLLDSKWSQKAEQRIASAESSYRKKIDSLYAALLDAAAKRHLEPAAANSAWKKLAALEAAGADASLLAQGRAAIGQAYLELARKARAGKRWDIARQNVQQGLQSQPGEALLVSLQGEAAEIERAELAAQQQLAQAEREALEKQREAKIQQFHDAFGQSLAVKSYDAAAARASIQKLEQLAAVSPTDALISKGRTQVTEHLVRQIKALSSRAQWEQALALANDAVKVIPGSEQLSKALTDIERGQAQQLAMDRESKIEQHKQSLAGLLEQPDFDEEWETKLRTDLKVLTELLPADDAWLATQREQLAALYLDRARSMRDGQRFSEAAGLLERGARFAPQNTGFVEETRLLAKAEGIFNEENREKLRMARIEGSKQTLRTQARANDLRNAKKTLKVLQAELPKDDPFLLKDAPQVLGGAYLRLADSAARKKNFDSAMKLLAAGIQVAPDMPELGRARERYEREARVYRKARQFASITKLDVAKEKQALLDLEAGDKSAQAGVRKELAAALYKRVRALAAQDFRSAENLLVSARQLFPDDTRLAGLKIARPVARAPAPSAPTSAAGTVPMQTARSSAGNCRPTLAGYGRRSRGTCYDVLSGDAKGPLLVVVPAGEGIGHPYAISKYEISVSDYNQYCQVSGECTGVRGAADDLPVTGISYKQARAYAAWISQQSGYVYRLPTEQEWTYAANAQGKQPTKDFNCRVTLGSQVIKGQALGSVKMGKPNGWGLKNYIGNAQEWVVTKNGIRANGGAFSDSLSNCSISMSKAHDGKADSITGFRLVREIKLGS